MSAAVLKDLKDRGIYGWLDGIGQRPRWGVYGGGHLSPEQKAWVKKNAGSLFRAMVGARVTAPPESEERIYAAWAASRAADASPPPPPPTPTTKEITMSQSALLAPPGTLVVSLEALRRVTGLVSRAIAGRGPLPILSHVRFTPSADVLHMQATDTELEISATCGAKSAMEGAFTLPGKQLSEILAKLQGPEVELSRGPGDGEIILRCLRSKFTLRSLVAAEFPRMEEPNTSKITLPAGVLAAALKGTLYACADDQKGIISGVLLNLQSGHLDVVATDGYRLAVSTHNVEEAQHASVVVPGRGAAEVLRAAAAAAPEDLVAIDLAPKAARFTFRGHVITTRILNGQFPGYQAVTPKSAVRTATMHRASLQAAVERASIMTTEEDARLILLHFSKPQGLTITAHASERGGVEELVAAELVGEGQDPAEDPVGLNWLQVYFNAHFLSQALNALRGETVTLYLNGPLAPVVARTEEAGLTAILMPVNRG